MTWSFSFWRSDANASPNPDPYDSANAEPDEDNPLDAMPKTKKLAGGHSSSGASRPKPSEPNKASPSSHTGSKPYDVARGGQSAKSGPATKPTSITPAFDATSASAGPDPKSAYIPIDQRTKSQSYSQHATPKAAIVTNTSQPSPAEVQLRRDYEALDAKYKELDEKHKAQEALFQIRSRELRGVEAYTLSANTDDELNVIGAIDQLNNTIEHAAGVIADAFEDLAERSSNGSAPNQVRDVRYTHWAMQEVQEKLGKTMYDLICTADTRFYGQPIKPTGNRDALEWAVASYLCWWSVRLFSRLTDAESEGGDELRRVYESIRATEPQTISARWRVLASKVLEQAESPSAVRIRQGLAGLLYLAGLSEGALKDASLVKALDKYAGKVDHEAREVKHRALQGIVTCDLEIFTVPPGQCISPQDLRRVGNDPRAQKASQNRDGKPKTEKHTYQMAISTVRVGVKRVKMDVVMGRYMVPREEVVTLPTVVLHEDFKRS